MGIVNEGRAPNPFQPAEQVAPKVKCLIYGASGIGKTYLALTAPGPIAVIDTEGGTAFYANRVGTGGLSPFDVLPTKTFAQVERAIAYLRDHPGHYQALVIDPVTVLYETLQDAAQVRRQEVNRRNRRGDPEDADLEMLDWQRIKRAYKRLMTDLVNLPMHVVVVAREAELTEERTSTTGRKERVKIGYRPDAEKSTAYYFDIVLRLVPSKAGRDALVEKDRTGTHDLNARIAGPTFDRLFGSAIAAGAEGTAERSVQSDEEAARIDADSTIVVAELADEQEEVVPHGTITRTGIVKKGSGRRSDLSARMTPDGYMLGFRLETEAGKAIPQVVAEGPLGTALYAALPDGADSLRDAQVTVAGRLFEVIVPGRRPYFRLVLDRIEHPDFTIPAGESAEIEEDDPPAQEAATATLFSPEESAAIDEALAV